MDGKDGNPACGPLANPRPESPVPRNVVFEFGGFAHGAASNTRPLFLRDNRTRGTALHSRCKRPGSCQPHLSCGVVTFEPPEANLISKEIGMDEKPECNKDVNAGCEPLQTEQMEVLAH